MHRILTITSTCLFLAAPAFAEGDVEKGEDTFKKCKSCHMIASAEETFVKGGKTGPNLFGVVGRTAGSLEGYKYSKSLAAAGEAGLVWDEESLAAFVADPKAFLKETLDDSKAKSKMSYKLKKGGEDVAAYLATFGADDESDDEEEEAAEDSSDS